MDHLFLSGNQRSGKTLLQLILASHPEVTISPGTNVIAKVLYEVPRNRPLTPDELRKFRQVLQKDRKFKAWRIDHTAYQAHIAKYKDVTSSQIVEDIMSFFRDQTKPAARYLGNKKGCYCKEGDIVKRVFPRAKLVFLLRDARGAVSSMLETQPEHDIVSASLTWMLKATRIRALKAEFPRDVFVCRYEELVQSPEQMVRSLTDFLEIDFVPAMLEQYKHNDVIRHQTDTTHPETYQAITTRMVDEWKTHLTEDQIATVEGLVGKELEESGYVRTMPKRDPVTRAKHRVLREREYLTWRLSHERKKRRVG